jgi:hypothetical protein
VQHSVFFWEDTDVSEKNYISIFTVEMSRLSKLKMEEAYFSEMFVSAYKAS